MKMNPWFLMLIQVLVFGIILIFVVTAVTLVFSMMRPKIVTYPWKFAASEEERKNDKQRTVILAGSYNPPHNGHVAMIKYLSERYGKVIAVIGINPNKKYDVHPNDRAKILRKCFGGNLNVANIRVQVVSGYIWRFAKKNDATILFRGIRSWEKDGREEFQLQGLNTFGPIVLGPLWSPIPTIYLEGNPEYNHVSSTLIRSMCNGKAQGVLLKGLVPDHVVSIVANFYIKNKKVNKEE